MKLKIMKILNVLATATLISFSIMSALGLLALLPTGIIEYLSTILSKEITQLDMAMISTTFGISAGAGGTMKIIMSSIKKHTDIEKIKTQMALDALKQELDDTKSQFVDVVEVIVPHINELKDSVREANRLSKLNRDFNIITAERNLASSDILVPIEVKNRYLDYVKASQTNKEFSLKNISAVIHKYETILEEKPIVEEIKGVSEGIGDIEEDNSWKL